MMPSRSFTLSVAILNLLSRCYYGFSPSTSSVRSFGNIAASRIQHNTNLYVSSTNTQQSDTPVILPDFTSEEEYMKYMESVAALPKGFATGTADGTFISKEAPGMGNLKIRATVIYLTEGPSPNWAAVYTSNKVS